METLSDWIAINKPPTGTMIIEGQRVHESVLERIGETTFRLPYIPKATHPSIPRFWEMVDDRSWQQQWLEPWGI